MCDDLIIQELESLREKVKILTLIVKYHEPNLNLNDLAHDLTVGDSLEYGEYCKGRDAIWLTPQMYSILNNRRNIW